MKHDEQDIIKQRFAESVVSNNSRNFWREVRKMNGSTRFCSSSVDGLSDANDIATLFAIKYQELYNSVSYNHYEMGVIRDELQRRVATQGFSDNAMIGSL